ncbi:MAG TPA: glycosyltransferase family 4 protein [Rubricoccaceae bacterium]
MRLTFVLPAPIRVPVGGAAVVYRHAAVLVRRGHRVTVVVPRRTSGGVTGAARALAVRVRDRLHGVAGASVYDEAGVETVEVDRVDGRSVPASEAVIATGFQTIAPVLSLPRESGVKVHFVQGDETFVDPAARSAWKLPFVRIACAPWLADAVRAEGGTCLGVVPNAADPAFFACDAGADRPPGVLALYHRHPVKGPDVLVDALARLHRARPDVTADVFCARRPSHRLPSHVRVHVRPSFADLRDLYARSAVFLHTSRSEGWPLTPMEAAASGCAVVATRNPGIEDVLACGSSMRCVGPEDGEALASAALDVLARPDERRRLGEAARARASEFDWDALTARFEALLVRALEGR